MNELQFYSNDVCPFAYRVRLTLAEKKITHQSHTIDLLDIPEWYYEVSPTGKVPLLKQGDNVIWESSIINEYLEDAYPDIPLLPKNAIERANARLWIDYCNTTFQPDYCGLVFELDESKHEAIRNRLYESLKTIDEALQKTAHGPYWLGKQLSLVDIAYYPFFEHAPVLSHYRQFDIPVEHKHINRWLSAMRERPSVIANQCDAAFYIEAYKPFVEGKVEHD